MLKRVGQVVAESGPVGRSRLSWVVTPEQELLASLPSRFGRALLVLTVEEVDHLMLDLAEARGEMQPAPMAGQVEVNIRQLRRALLDGT